MCLERWDSSKSEFQLYCLYHRNTFKLRSKSKSNCKPSREEITWETQIWGYIRDMDLRETGRENFDWI